MQRTHPNYMQYFTPSMQKKKHALSLFPLVLAAP